MSLKVVTYATNRMLYAKCDANRTWITQVPVRQFNFSQALRVVLVRRLASVRRRASSRSSVSTPATLSVLFNRPTGTATACGGGSSSRGGCLRHKGSWGSGGLWGSGGSRSRGSCAGCWRAASATGRATRAADGIRARRLVSLRDVRRVDVDEDAWV